MIQEIFSHINGLSVLNSYIVLKTMKHQNFQLSKFELEIIQEAIVRCVAKKKRVSEPLSAHLLQLIARHFLSLVPPTDSYQTPQRCYVCSNTERRAGQRSDTRYQCTENDAVL